MTTQHTPGPWKLDKTTTRGEFCWDYKIRSADDSAICTIGPCAQDANARLIAAAPDLFMALVRILAAHDSKNSGAVMGEAVLCKAFADEARAAIAKAKGKA